MSWFAERKFCMSIASLRSLACFCVFQAFFSSASFRGMSEGSTSLWYASGMSARIVWWLTLTNAWYSRLTPKDGCGAVGRSGWLFCGRGGVGRLGEGGLGLCAAGGLCGGW